MKHRTWVLALDLACTVACGRVGYYEIGLDPEGAGGSFGSSGAVGAAGAAGRRISGASGSAGSSGSTSVGAGGTFSSAGGAGGATGIGGSLGGGSGSGGGAGFDSASAMYQLINQAAGKCLDVPLSSTADGAAMEILTCTGGANQLFRFHDVPGGLYTVTNVNSGKCLSGANVTKASVVQTTCTGAMDQMFSRVPLSAGHESFVNVASRLCVDNTDGITAEGNIEQFYTCNGTSNQAWQVLALAGTCTPESDISFCSRLGAFCDGTSGVDNCGTTRSVADCGACTPLQQACGVTAPNACGDIGKVNLAQGGTVTSSAPSTAPTDMTMAFDSDANTKWFVTTTTTPWIAYQFAGSARNVVTSYSITSADDVTDRDPASWQFQGSNNGNAWTTLDTRANQRFANRHQTNLYRVANTTAYAFYRFNFTGTFQSPIYFQLSEIQLFP